jgi:hypothetical protein
MESRYLKQYSYQATGWMTEEAGFDFRHGHPRMALMAHSFFYSVGIGISFPRGKAATA